MVSVNVVHESARASERLRRVPYGLSAVQDVARDAGQRSHRPPASIPGKGVMCIDFAVGVRFEERGKGLPDGALGTNLGALRLPERTLHLADGRVLKVS